MKKYLLATAALLILAVSCGKEKIETKKEIERKDPTSISFSKASVDLIEGDSETVSIKWSPSYAKEPVLTVHDEKTQTRMIVSSNDESIARAVGTKIVAVSPGDAVITAKLANNPSVYATCNVTVNEDVHASAVESIIVSSSSFTLCDLNSEGAGDDFGINVRLSPSERTWDDVTVFTDDDRLTITKGERKSDGIYELRVKIAANIAHYPTDERTAKITIKAKKGDVSKVLNATIRGHVYGISIPKLQSSTEDAVHNGKVLLVKGKTFDLETEILKTGANAQGTITYTSSKSDVLSVTSSGVLSVSGTPEGGSVQRKVTVSCSAAYGVSPIEVPVYTYATATAFTFKLNGDAVEGKSVLKGGVKNMILSVVASPSNALCDIKINSKSYTSYGTDDLSNVTVTNNQGNISKIEFDTSVYGSYSADDYIQITSWATNASATWNFQVDAYSASDIKEGDFAYYVKGDSNSFFYYYSDGGLRAHGPEFSWIRQESISPVSSANLIGIIYYVNDGYSNVNGLQLRGFWYYGIKDSWAKYNGKVAHAAVISARDPKAGTYTWPWSSSYFNIEAGSNWNSSTYGQPPKENANRSSYLVYEGLRHWNAAVSESKRVKAIYSVDNYNDYDGLTENAGKSGSLPLRKATGSQYGSTGWVIPLKYDMELLNDVLKIVNKSISSAKSFSSGCADNLQGPYWLANYSTDKYTPPSGYSVDWAMAYYFDPSMTNKYQTGVKDVKILGTRPIVFI